MVLHSYITKEGETMSAHRNKAKHSMRTSNFGASVNTIRKSNHRWKVTGKNQNLVSLQQIFR